MAGIKLVLALLDRWVVARNSGSVEPRLQVLAYSTAGIFGLATVFNVLLLASDFTGKHLNPQLRVIDKFAALPNGENVVDLYRRLTPGVGPTDVVIAPVSLAWPLPTVTGKAVVAYHQNPLLTDQFERLDVVAEFFTLGTDSQRRHEIIEAYQVSYMLLNVSDAPESFLDWTVVVAEPIAVVGDYTMYRFLPTS